jgi:hypothetical protein
MIDGDRLSQTTAAVPKDQRSGRVNHHSPVEAKITLFRSLFRERDDVYPRRLESRRTGKSGYQPACANEWICGLCEKPRASAPNAQAALFSPLQTR